MKIKQAIILAGGRGTRLAPFTDTSPKPMVPICGKPFLEHLLLLLKENGIEEVVLLLGYKSDQIQDYFKDGKEFGVRILYSVMPVEDDTGTRVRKAEKLLQSEFLLLYADNYWPLNLERLQAFHEEKEVVGTVTVFKNEKKIGRDNIRVNRSGFVDLYDNSRTNETANGVEIGFMILRKKVLEYMPEENFSFNDVITSLVKDGELAGYVTSQKYYSVGSPDRLRATTEFLSPRHVLFLDRDGVINVRPPQGEYVTTWENFEFLPPALSALKLLKDQGFEVYIISNQPGVVRGAMTLKDLEDINERFLEAVERNGGEVHGIYQCLHDREEGCACRKPAPGLFFTAADGHNINLSLSWFIGDDERDEVAGTAAGVKTILIPSNGDLYAAVKKIILSE